MTQPSPAIVPQGAVRRLPHFALWLFALAYVLPGFIGRTPWRNADITAYGYMAELAAGRTDWLAPTLQGMPPDVDGLLPYWLGAWALQLAPSWIQPGFAARLPYIALLALTLICVWQGIYYLARSPLAQPVAFAFGGEARPRDYARAMADGGLLAFIASLGLAQLSHETTPALAQLCFVALSFYAFAALPYRRWTPALSALAGLTGLTLSGGPSMALLLATGGLLAHALDSRQAQEEPRRHRRGLWRLTALTVFIALLATALELWRWRIGLPAGTASWQSLGRLLLWFTWPLWPLVLWTLWRWRRQLFDRRPSRHLSLPLWYLLITVGATLLTPASDRALLLALPALATLAAFALPTMNRSVSAIIDWFTLLFFTTCALVIWVVWVAMLTGTPPQPAANVARLLPGFEPRFVILPFVFATLATLAWAWLVKWRIGRHRAALWKSMVLPAGGAALCWLLLTTLWMPALNHARSYAPLVQRVVDVVPPGTTCLAYFGLSRSQLAGLQVHGPYALEPLTDRTPCGWLLLDRETVEQTPEIVNAALWERVARFDHPRPGDQGLVLFRRRPVDSPAASPR